tara:strand:+ start:815 stop:1375 length:561 start_codon:yes stop_codon:yes gene_type:complete
MKSKDQLRKKFLTLRKKKYFDVSSKKFSGLINYLKRKIKTKQNLVIALYYPSNYEINILNIMGNLKKNKAIFVLPKIQDNNSLKFIEWNERDILLVNKFGIPEPHKNKQKHLPDILLVPMLAFDSNKNRIGYGKGFYDRCLSRLVKLNKKIESIGVAFSFQKYKKIPSSKFDFKLDKIFTEAGFIQ